MQSQDAARFGPPTKSCGKCGAWLGCLGLEPTPEMYVQHLVEIFREVKRVLKKDGTFWLNIGDSYSGSGGSSGHTIETKNLGRKTFEYGAYPSSAMKKPGILKSKDLCGIPWRVAFALQADEWWLRSDIIWSKPNPMPESVRDRPTRSHEYIFLLSKSAKYYFDSEAVKENYSSSYLNDSRHVTGSTDRNEKVGYLESLAQNPKKLHRMFDKPMGIGRNIRSVWTITTKPFKDAHFATFPPELPERCIKAGTSEKGVCPKCGAPWVRIISPTKEYSEALNRLRIVKDRFPRKDNEIHSCHVKGDNQSSQYETLGWKPSCKCNAGEPIPAIVLDPFAGAGTTGMIAKELGRNYILIDIKPEYVEMARKRIAKVGYQMEIAEERLGQGVL
jgi:DNA modification methylase